MAEKTSGGIQAEGGSSAAMKEEEEDNASTCPLFMEGLPSNFAKNKGLSALASLLNDEEDDYKKQNIDKEDSNSMSKVELKSGGGKVQRKNRRKVCSSPYNKEKKKVNLDKKVGTSVGEAQLFLNLWKI
ncbi:hypothetical protein ACHAXM_011636 [Skeletonema potamos]|jgi:hypothetical protein